MASKRWAGGGAERGADRPDACQRGVEGGLGIAAMGGVLQRLELGVEAWQALRLEERREVLQQLLAGMGHVHGRAFGVLGVHAAAEVALDQRKAGQDGDHGVLGRKRAALAGFSGLAAFGAGLPRLARLGGLGTFARLTGLG
jgi:hypothetical protein